MKQSRFTPEQIIGILKEQQAGMAPAKLCRRHGISDATFYSWRKKPKLIQSARGYGYMFSGNVE